MFPFSVSLLASHDNSHLMIISSCGHLCLCLSLFLTISLSSLSVRLTVRLTVHLSLPNSHLRLQRVGIDVDAVWKDITVLILKSLVAVDMHMTYQPCSFEVFGYDVLIDQNLRPWLIEVNASPSLSRDNQLDHRVKDAMIRDTIKLIDPAPFDRAAIPKILRRRMKDTKNVSLSAKKDKNLEADLKSILGGDSGKGWVPRKYGEIPREMGEYEMLCPGTKGYAHVLKLKRAIMKDPVV